MSFTETGGLAVVNCMNFINRTVDLSVCEFGNQRFTITKDFFKRYILEKVSKFNEFSIPGDFYPDSTKNFYSSIGFSDYLAIDLNTKMDSIIMDLNKNFSKDYKFDKQFDLVTNIGTGEHVFDQKIVFENMHNLTKVGGIMLNILPFYMSLNHGFFNFHPVLFRDLAFANNYDWCFLWIGDCFGKFKEFSTNGDVFKEIKRARPFSLRETFRRPYSYLEKFIYSNRSHRGHDYIIAAYQKTSESEFSIPIQGKWIHNIDKEKAKGVILNYDQPDTFKRHHS